MERVREERRPRMHAALQDTPVTVLLTLISACLRHFRRNWLRPVAGMRRALSAATGLASESGVAGMVEACVARLRAAAGKPPPRPYHKAFLPLVEAGAAKPRPVGRAAAARQAPIRAAADDGAAEGDAGPLARAAAAAARRSRPARVAGPRMLGGWGCAGGLCRGRERGECEFAVGTPALFRPPSSSHPAITPPDDMRPPPSPQRARQNAMNGQCCFFTTGPASLAISSPTPFSIQFTQFSPAATHAPAGCRRSGQSAGGTA